MLTLKSFLSGETDRVVYWGTSDERITSKYDFDAFCTSELLDSGTLIYGSDIKSCLPRPTYDELKTNVQRHYETIRNYGKETGRNFYSYGWLLDIARCIFTLRTGKIISKTAAGEWALIHKVKTPLLNNNHFWLFFAVLKIEQRLGQKDVVPYPAHSCSVFRKGQLF